MFFPFPRLKVHGTPHVAINVLLHRLDGGKGGPSGSITHLPGVLRELYRQTRLASSGEEGRDPAQEIDRNPWGARRRKQLVPWPDKTLTVL